jgi:hypothetical protein
MAKQTVSSWETVSSWADQSDWRKGMDQELEPPVQPFSKSGPALIYSLYRLLIVIIIFFLHALDYRCSILWFRFN